LLKKHKRTKKIRSRSWKQRELGGRRIRRRERERRRKRIRRRRRE
jgi:hypothetical protein